MIVDLLLSFNLATHSSFPKLEKHQNLTSVELKFLSLSSDNENLKSPDLDLLTTTSKAANSENQLTPETKRENITQILFSGNTAFSNEELAKVVAPYLGQEISPENLIALRIAITEFYTNQGFTTSAAFVPPQEISNGVIRIQIIEGRLEQIKITGLKRIRENYVRSRILLAANAPLNTERLQEALQLLAINPLFERVQAELQQGSSPGLSVLTINLIEAPAVLVALQFDNFEPPESGEYKGTVALEHQNLLGFGDRFSATYGITEGLDKYDFSYRIPVNARNGTIEVGFRNDDSEITEAPFADIGIRAESQTFSLGFRQPLIERLTEEFALSLSLELRQSKTFILDDIPFSFAEGPENGESKITVVRFTQEWIKRSPSRVFAARSQFSLGVNAFEATINESGIDGDFFSWFGQLQWVEKVGEDTILVARLNAQLTPNSLLPIEQFTIGGVDTVRGYRQNLLVDDSGINGSIEARFRIFEASDSNITLELSPFVDFGTVWNKRNESEPNTLISTGLGLSLQLGDSLFAQLTYGIPLIKVDNQRDSLQEEGFSLLFRWQKKF